MASPRGSKTDQSQGQCQSMILITKCKVSVMSYHLTNHRGGCPGMHVLGQYLDEQTKRQKISWTDIPLLQICKSCIKKRQQNTVGKATLNISNQTEIMQIQTKEWNERRKWTNNRNSNSISQHGLDQNQSADALKAAGLCQLHI